MKQNPGSNNVIKDILRRLSRGESREKIAEAMGYKNYRSLHTYMTRKGYTWDPRQGNYSLAEHKEEKTPPYTSQTLFDEKAERIIALLEEGADAKQVAKRLDFSRYLDMAAYMGERGYRWDPIKQNYIPEQPKPLHADEKDKNNKAINLETAPNQAEHTALTWLNAIDGYISAMQWLITHRGKLEQIINSGGHQGEVKSYHISGKKISATIQAPKPLVKLVTKFSQENDIQDDDLVQTAVVEYLKVHGYEEEVSTLLN